MPIAKGFNRDDFTGFFDNYKFFINPETNEIEIKFICKDCKKIMSKDEMLNGHHQMKISGPGGPLEYHTAIFICRDCVIKTMNEKEDGK